MESPSCKKCGVSFRNSEEFRKHIESSEQHRFRKPDVFDKTFGFLQKDPKSKYWPKRHPLLFIMLGFVALICILASLLPIDKETRQHNEKIQSFVNQLNNAGENLRLYSGEGEKGRPLSLHDTYKMTLLKEYGAKFEIIGDNPVGCEIIGWVPMRVWDSYEYQWKIAFIRMIFFEIEQFTGAEMHSVTIKDLNSGEILAKMNLFGEKVYR
jgi:uncharacterized C2H2 Zn-finger protein